MIIAITPKAAKIVIVCIVDNTTSTRVSLVHLTNPYRNESQSNVLDIEDKGVCSS